MRGYNRKLHKLLQWELDPAFKRRAKFIALAVNEAIKNKKGVRVLEVGCGRGFYENLLTRLDQNLDIIGVDTNEKYIEAARKSQRSNRVSFVKADGHTLPFEDQRFDVVICSEVLEHVTDDERVLNEINRVTKAQGKLVVSVPVKNYPFAWDPLNWLLERTVGWHVPANIWWLAGIWADHVRLYNENELIKKITKTGWRVEEIVRCTKDCAPATHFLLYGIGKNIVERGWGNNFDRFNFGEKKSLLLKLVINFLGLWDKKNDTKVIGKNEPFVNLVLVAKK